MKGLINGYSFLVNVVWIFGGIAIHIYTVLMSMGEYGLVGAVITFLTPGIAELFWIVKSTIDYGFLNIYNVLIIVHFVVKWIGMLVIAGLFHLAEKRGVEL
ncbi:hypothetical protein JNUCC23_09570 [Peribacillus sp. JNUCC 23]